MGVLVGKKAPSFKAPAVINGGEIVEDFSLDQYIGEKSSCIFLLSKGFHFRLSFRITCFSSKIRRIRRTRSKSCCLLN